MDAGAITPRRDQVSSVARKKNDRSTLNGRFMEAIQALGYSGYSLSKVLGTSEAVISNIRNHKNPPNIVLVCDLLEKHPEIDPDWLLCGRGAMMRGGARAGRKAHSAVADKAVAEMQERLQELERRMEEVSSGRKRAR